MFPGAHIREGVSVGASSLVIKETEAWGIYVGTPAQRIKNRKKGLLDQEETFLAEIRGETHS